MKGGEICEKCGGTKPLIFEDGEKAELRNMYFYGCTCRSHKERKR